MSSPLSLSAPQPLPPPPPLSRLLGPSFIILGLGLGSGELILWPYLSSNHGLGMAWAIIVGVTIQFFINMEASRHALIYGESIFVGFARWLKGLPFWFIFSTFVGFGWPGIGLASATLFSHLFGLPLLPVSIFLFLGIGLVLTFGTYIYATVERLAKFIILFGTPFIFLLTFYLSRAAHWQALFQGLAGQAPDYFLLPAGISLTTFLGALAFSGAGGNLNLAQSFYVRDKGYGMGAFAQKIGSLFTSSGRKDFRLSGQTFPLTQKNLTTFRHWWRLANTEHLLVFWFLGLLTMLTLTLLAYITTYGHPQNPEGIAFILTEAAAISRATLPFLGSLFLIVTGLMLASTQLTVLDSTSRIITENLLLLRHHSSAHVSRLYYSVLWIQIAFSLTILGLGFTQPRQLITLSAAINGFAMFIYLILILWHHNTRLPAPLRPSLFRNLALAASTLFFGYFCFLTLT